MYKKQISCVPCKKANIFFWRGHKKQVKERDQSKELKLKKTEKG